MKTLDSIATNLVIQVMPLLMREFQVRLDPQQLFSDPSYAAHMMRLASTARSERLKTCAAQLQDRLRVLDTRAAPGAVTAAGPAATAETGAQQLATPPSKYVRSLR